MHDARDAYGVKPRLAMRGEERRRRRASATGGVLGVVVGNWPGPLHAAISVIADPLLPSWMLHGKLFNQRQVFCKSAAPAWTGHITPTCAGRPPASPCHWPHSTTVIYIQLARLFPSLVAVRSLHRALLQTPNERSLRVLVSIHKRQRSYRSIVIKLQFQLPNLTLITIIIRWWFLCLKPIFTSIRLLHFALRNIFYLLYQRCIIYS